LLSNKFLQTISKLVPGGTLSAKELQLLSSLNPDKIYVENVRSILGVSHRSAVRILETAVRQGLFKRGIEIQCPDGTVAASADAEEKLPVTVHCWTEEEGHPKEVELPTESLTKTTFYRLNDESDSITFGQTA